MFRVNLESRPVARIDLGGGVQDPQKVDFFEPHPLTLLQKPHFWPTLWLKVDLLADLLESITFMKVRKIMYLDKAYIIAMVLDFPLGAPNTLLKHVIERSIWRIVVGEGSWWGWGFSQDW